MAKTKLTVKYLNPQHEINKDLDYEIEKFFKSRGFEWVSAGIAYKGGERDIEFEKEQKV